MGINMKQKQNERKVKQGTGTGREKAIHRLMLKSYSAQFFHPES